VGVENECDEHERELLVRIPRFASLGQLPRRNHSGSDARTQEDLIDFR
jgi:hypothetical protein